MMQLNAQILFNDHNVEIRFFFNLIQSLKFSFLWGMMIQRPKFFNMPHSKLFLMHYCSNNFPSQLISIRNLQSLGSNEKKTEQKTTIIDQNKIIRHCTETEGSFFAWLLFEEFELALAWKYALLYINSQ